MKKERLSKRIYKIKEHALKDLITILDRLNKIFKSNTKIPTYVYLIMIKNLCERIMIFFTANSHFSLYDINNEIIIISIFLMENKTSRNRTMSVVKCRSAHGVKWFPGGLEKFSPGNLARPIDFRARNDQYTE